MIDIFAQYIDGILVCTPKKRRGMTKGEYLRALSACEGLNVDGTLSSSLLAASLPAHIARDLIPSSQLPPSAKKNTLERAPIVIGSRQDDVPQPMQLSLFYTPDQ